MPYSPISKSNLSLLKNILLYATLEKEILIKVEKLGLVFKANKLSVAEPSGEYEEMNETCFMLDDSTDVLTVEGRFYSVFYNVGEWGYETRIPASHVCLGTRPLKFGSDYFCQLELSQSLQDDENIYIVKNISKLAGEGAISRLNNGLGKNRVQKHKRRLLLKEKKGYKSIIYENNEWLSLSSVNIADLKNEDEKSKVLCGLMSDFLEYAFAIEEIIS